MKRPLIKWTEEEKDVLLDYRVMKKLIDLKINIK